MDSPADTIAQPPQEAHTLQCMEIWGGNRAKEERVNVTGLEGYVFCQPYRGEAAGGDIHYASMCGSGRVTRFVVADVAGHGDAVNALAVELRTLMRKYINVADQTRLVRGLNSEFAKLAESGHFATAVLATYFAPTDHLIIVNAGHPRPMHYASATKRWRVLDPQAVDASSAPRNLPLGIIDPTDYCQFAVRLEPDDYVLLYTDSLIEATSPKGEQLGEAGLIRLLHETPLGDPQQAGRALLESVRLHRAGAPADDDVTLLLLRHHAGRHPHQSVGEWARTIARMLGILPV